MEKVVGLPVWNHRHVVITDAFTPTPVHQTGAGTWWAVVLCSCITYLSVTYVISVTLVYT